MDKNHELKQLEKKLLQTLPESLHDFILKEIQFFEFLSDEPGMQMEGIRYLNTLFSLPWNYDSPPTTTFKHLVRSLNKSHFGMQDTKDLLTEYLAVLKMKNSKNKSPIFLLVGSPGTGKSTMAKAIGKALNRPVETIFLGGMSDTKVLSGSARVYKQAELGTLLKAYKKTKTRHSIIVFDEIDKCSEAVNYSLLSILDYSQNYEYQDQYLGIPFDLSSTIFIATANNKNKIHPALLDRMEVIEIESYTLTDKLKISRDYLLPKIISDMGLAKNHYNIDQAVLRTIISNYTREGGVRQLTRVLEKIGRKITKEVLAKSRTHFRRMLTQDEVIKYLGPAKFTEFASGDMPCGSVNGLAYNSSGGAVLTIETALIPTKTKPKLLVTGLPGPMMDESSKIVLSLIKSKGHEWDLDINRLHNNDLHIHYPECTGDGVDGPSAGGAMFLAVYSLLKGITIPSHIALTGEINLRGYITEIGGLKEKLMAADRMKKTVVLIPYENIKDLVKVPDEVKKNIKIIPIKTIYELLSAVGV